MKSSQFTFQTLRPIVDLDGGNGSGFTVPTYKIGRYEHNGPAGGMALPGVNTRSLPAIAEWPPITISSTSWAANVLTVTLPVRHRIPFGFKCRVVLLGMKLVSNSVQKPSWDATYVATAHASNQNVFTVTNTIAADPGGSMTGIAIVLSLRANIREVNWLARKQLSAPQDVFHFNTGMFNLNAAGYWDQWEVELRDAGLLSLWGGAILDHMNRDNGYGRGIQIAHFFSTPLESDPTVEQRHNPNQAGADTDSYPVEAEATKDWPPHGSICHGFRETTRAELSPLIPLSKEVVSEYTPLDFIGGGPGAAFTTVNGKVVNSGHHGGDRYHMIGWVGGHWQQKTILNCYPWEQAHTCEVHRQEQIITIPENVTLFSPASSWLLNSPVVTLRGNAGKATNGRNAIGVNKVFFNAVYFLRKRLTDNLAEMVWLSQSSSTPISISSTSAGGNKPVVTLALAITTQLPNIPTDGTAAVAIYISSATDAAINNQVHFATVLTATTLQLYLPDGVTTVGGGAAGTVRFEMPKISDDAARWNIGARYSMAEGGFRFVYTKDGTTAIAYTADAASSAPDTTTLGQTETDIPPIAPTNHFYPQVMLAYEKSGADPDYLIGFYGAWEGTAGKDLDPASAIDGTHGPGTFVSLVTMRASDAAITFANRHSFGVNDQIKFAVSASGTFPSDITAGTTYYVKTAVTNTITISATPGGAAITFTSNAVAEARIPVGAAINGPPAQGTLGYLEWQAYSDGVDSNSPDLGPSTTMAFNVTSGINGPFGLLRAETVRKQSWIVTCPGVTVSPGASRTNLRLFFQNHLTNPATFNLV